MDKQTSETTTVKDCTRKKQIHLVDWSEHVPSVKGGYVKIESKTECPKKTAQRHCASCVPHIDMCLIDIHVYMLV